MFHVSCFNCKKVSVEISFQFNFLLNRFILKRVPGYESFEYKPEAAIVNFYTMDSSIGGHTDHSEPNKSAPLGNISSVRDNTI